jgi:hypothetical protein
LSVCCVLTYSSNDSLLNLLFLYGNMTGLLRWIALLSCCSRFLGSVRHHIVRGFVAVHEAIRKWFSMKIACLFLQLHSLTHFQFLLFIHPLNDFLYSSQDENLRSFMRKAIPDDPQLEPRIPFGLGTVSFAGKCNSVVSIPMSLPT